MNYFELELENDRWLNPTQFVKFCVANQQQDIIVQVNNEGHCLTHCGVYDVLDLFEFKSVTIHTANALEQHDRYTVNSKTWQYWLSNISSFDHAYDYAWTEQKLFGCFYGRPSAPRLGIAAHLGKYFKQQSLIRTKFQFDSEDHRKLFDIQQLFAWHPGAVESIMSLQHPDYCSDEIYVKGHYDPGNTLSHLYQDILIDLIVEPVCHGTSFYPTEKLARAVLCKRPFIVMGSRDYLAYVRQLGFHTFNEFWDEYYDGFDSGQRYCKILNLINSLAKQPHQHSVDMYYAMTYQLEHNYNLLVNNAYNKTLTKI